MQTKLKLLIAAGGVALLIACGGGSSARLTVTGTAATGLAIAGASVTGKCIAGSGTATTESDGSFTLNVNGGQLPCVLQIINPDGGGKLHTVVVGTGSTATANITPLTDLVTARMLGRTPTDFFSSFDAAIAAQKVTNTAVQAAQTDIGLVLSGIVDTTSLGDFISTPLKAATQSNPDGGDTQDKLLDRLKLQLNSLQINALVEALANSEAIDAVKQVAGGFATPITTYKAGLAIGESGDLIIDTENLTYSLTIQKSSYGLTGKVLSGAIEKNVDGTYRIVDTTGGTIFDYGNYAVLTLKVDKNDADYKSFFDTYTEITTQRTYIPIFSTKSNSLIRTVDGIISNGASFEFRSVEYSRRIISSGKRLVNTWALRGSINKISNTSFSVSFCSNNGKSSNNINLTTANCKGDLVSTRTYDYDAQSDSWLVTPIHPDHPKQVIRAYFVKDTVTNQVVGFADTSDETGESAKFGLISIVPNDTQFPLNDGNNSWGITSYQFCSGSPCYGDGIFVNDDIKLNVTGEEIVTDEGYGCIKTEKINDPENGFATVVFATVVFGENCTHRPDAILFTFGEKLVDGKKTFLSVFAGYSPIETFRKFGFNIFVQN